MNSRATESMSAHSRFENVLAARNIDKMNVLNSVKKSSRFDSLTVQASSRMSFGLGGWFASKSAKPKMAKPLPTQPHRLQMIAKASPESDAPIDQLENEYLEANVMTSEWFE